MSTTPIDIDVNPLGPGGPPTSARRPDVPPLPSPPLFAPLPPPPPSGRPPSLLQRDPESKPAAAGPPSPSLDFLSPSFDPFRALHTPGLQPPVPSVRPLDNIAKFRKLLPPELPDAITAPPKPATEESRKKHLSFKESALRARERIRTTTTVSLDGVHAAAAAASPGPLGSLRRWHAAGARVSVTTRHAGGVRGVATGTLAAYDRFMNLVLRDVTERYTVPVRRLKERTKLVPAASASVAAAEGVAVGSRGQQQQQPADGMVEVTCSRLIRRREVRQRQLGQVFIKGDNVVAVHAAAAAEAGAAADAGLDGGRGAAAERRQQLATAWLQSAQGEPTAGGREYAQTAAPTASGVGAAARTQAGAAASETDGSAAAAAAWRAPAGAAAGASGEGRVPRPGQDGLAPGASAPAQHAGTAPVPRFGFGAVARRGVEGPAGRDRDDGPGRPEAGSGNWEDSVVLGQGPAGRSQGPGPGQEGFALPPRAGIGYGDGQYRRRGPGGPELGQGNAAPASGRQ